MTPSPDLREQSWLDALMGRKAGETADVAKGNLKGITNFVTTLLNYTPAGLMYSGLAGKPGLPPIPASNSTQQRTMTAGQHAMDISQIGMIPTPANLERFQALAQKELATLKSQAVADAAAGYAVPSGPAADKARRAMAWWSARHPWFAKHFQPDVVNYESAPAAAGFYHHTGDATGLVSVVPQPKSSVRNMIGVLGHETTHGIQSARNPAIWDNYPTIPSWKTSFRNIPGYLDHPAEVQANQGAATALEEALKYEDLVAAAKRNNLPLAEPTTLSEGLVSKGPTAPRTIPLSPSRPMPAPLGPPTKDELDTWAMEFYEKADKAAKGAIGGALNQRRRPITHLDEFPAEDIGREGFAEGYALGQNPSKFRDLAARYPEAKSWQEVLDKAAQKKMSDLAHRQMDEMFGVSDTVKGTVSLETPRGTSDESTATIGDIIADSTPSVEIAVESQPIRSLNVNTGEVLDAEKAAQEAQMQKVLEQVYHPVEHQILRQKLKMGETITLPRPNQSIHTAVTDSLGLSKQTGRNYNSAALTKAEEIVRTGKAPEFTLDNSLRHQITSFPYPVRRRALMETPFSVKHGQPMARMFIDGATPYDISRKVHGATKERIAISVKEFLATFNRLLSTQ